MKPPIFYQPNADRSTARIGRHITWALATLLCLMGSAAMASDRSSVLEAVQLPAWVERHGEQRPAQPGQMLRAGDLAITSSGARMLIRMPDRSVIKLGEDTRFVIEQMKMSPRDAAGRSELRAGLNLITGVFRYATDYTSKALGHSREVNLRMATATVGIRGTDFWSMTDADHDAVCVFEGKVDVLREGKDTIPLTKPGAFWVVFTGQPEQPAGQASPDQLAKFIGQADMQPGQGVLVAGGRWRVVAGVVSSATQASELRDRLRQAGYPAVAVIRQGRHEVRINELATKEDAEHVLAQLSTGDRLLLQASRVALSAD
ncbi:MAG: hypothetical protein EP308_10310 [Burkholderiales bacterium]|nr:MAG: hypothetical protein EP308_10310 [Burkholderiales bacterium]